MPDGSSGRLLKGRPASPGLAAGPVHVLAGQHVTRVPSGDPSTEAADLSAAIASASAALETLAAASAGEAADILGFQVALLSDDELSRPAFAAIADGVSADQAWSAALDTEIAGYQAAEEEYFRARAADLVDLRDRVLLTLAGAGADTIPAGAVVVGTDLPPSRFLGIDWSAGGAIVLTGGSPSSHVAVLARSRGVPMVVQLGGDPAALGDFALVDGGAGEIVPDPTGPERKAFAVRMEDERALAEKAAELLDKPAVAASGERILVNLNIADPGELKRIDPAHCDGVGLVRTEFLFHDRPQSPGEEAQFGVYRTMAEWAQGRPVVIRTLDAGGDKPIPGLTPAGESNPFLGVRGIRLSLRHPELLRTQLRALCRAAAYGEVKVMLPMVTVPSEVMVTRRMMDEIVAELAAEGRPHRRPALGIMVEVPATALALDAFDADFFSIGSNDLTQYATAAGRDIGEVAELADPLHPGVLRLIRAVAEQGRALGRDVSLCGEAGGDPAVLPHLLAAGLRSVSVSPAALARTKAAVATLDIPGLTAP